MKKSLFILSLATALFACKKEVQNLPNTPSTPGDNVLKLTIEGNPYEFDQNTYGIDFGAGSQYGQVPNSSDYSYSTHSDFDISENADAYKEGLKSLEVGFSGFVFPESDFLNDLNAVAEFITSVGQRPYASWQNTQGFEIFSRSVNGNFFSTKYGPQETATEVEVLSSEVFDETDQLLRRKVKGVLSECKLYDYNGENPIKIENLEFEIVLNFRKF